jgi:hypothetical protein
MDDVDEHDHRTLKRVYVENATIVVSGNESNVT